MVAGGERHKTWVKDFLVPHLIENQKLIPFKKENEHVCVKSIDMKLMSLEVAFMLTVCYFVKITVQKKLKHETCDQDFTDEKEFSLVIKVMKYFAHAEKNLVQF